jgi:hypothetical protein
MCESGVSHQGRLQGCAACAAAQGSERVGAPIPNHKFENSRALYGSWLEHNRMESKWKANRKHRNCECERDLTPHYFRCAEPRVQVATFTVVVYFIDNPCSFVCVCLASALLLCLHNLNDWQFHVSRVVLPQNPIVIFESKKILVYFDPIEG